MSKLKRQNKTPRADFNDLIYSILKTTPKQDVDRVSQQFSAMDMRMDLVLGTHLYNKASTELKKEFIQQEDYMIMYEDNHRLSGLKIISFLGQKIVRQSTTKWLTLNREFTKRNPVYKVADLY